MGWLEMTHPLVPANDEWSTGRCDCCAEPRVCCYERNCATNTMCCCCQTAYLYCCAYPVYVGKIPTESGVCCSGSCCGSFIARLFGIPCICCYDGTVRTHVRERYQIAGSKGFDRLQQCLCPPFWGMCTTCQVIREVHIRHLHGSDERRGSSSYQPTMQAPSTVAAPSLI